MFKAFMEMKYFLIVDDHEVVRKGLKLILSDFYPGATFLETGDGTDTIELLKKFKVELVILDIQMPNTNSFELLQYIVNVYPETKVLIFSMGAETLYGKRFIMAGAHGYLSKEASMPEIQKAIDTILSGKKYLTDKLVDMIIQNLARKTSENPFEKLSAREFEIATFLLKGFNVSEISESVHLQPSTVGTYKARIFEKLQVANLLELKELATVYNFQ